MLRLLFHATIILDRLFASKHQRADAKWHAFYADARYRGRALEHLHGLLANPRRRRSRRMLRLAIADVLRAEQHRHCA